MVNISPYLKKLWEEGKLSQDFTIGDVIDWAKSEGMRFNRRSILSAIRSANYLTATKKVSGIPHFAQKFPPKKADDEQSKPLNIQLFEHLDIHPEIRKVCSKLYLDGHYDHAVFSSFKKINNLVKKKSEQPDYDGKDLMLRVFTLKNPILKINKLKSTSEKNEQEGFMHLFAGAMQGIRNPRGHEDDKGGDPWESLDYICFASRLAKIIDGSTKVK